ncbi:glutamine amidotransferase family protein [Tardiphaga sp.]|uniref:class II glutamine amidotransferase n=1 Tax=Tardiphaga sp. TaxID=1926292 RepID=UPI0025E5F63E|nr:glutamine amidotransferase family protein [Tardiphaga sp.]
MCGIAGLFLKNAALEPQLGAMLHRMIETLSDRGPDSAGFAIYGKGDRGRIKVTLRIVGGDAAATIAELEREVGPLHAVTRSNHVIVSVATDLRERLVAAVARQAPAVEVVGSGARMELYKEVGLPGDVARRFALSSMSGTHGIGHTRMATESAVTTNGAHPFSTGLDQCLVHNGSLSNHHAVRRVLKREGLSFATDNDSEVAAGYLTWRMREGAGLKQALTQSLSDLDGFYTFVVGTETGFAVLRDPIACKPAVMAETDDYVAFGSEYRALDALPGIANARVFEPEPSIVYAWERH